MTSIFNNLQNLGFTKNQADVYIVLVRKGSAKAGEVINATGLHRNIVYTALNDLIKMKLVTQTMVRGIYLYKILSPARLISSIEEKCRLAELVAEQLSHIQKKVPEQEVVIFEGIEEFRKHAVRSFELASNGSTIYYLGTSPRWHNIVDKKTEKKLRSIQKEKGLFIKGIAYAPFSEADEWISESDGATELRFNKLVGINTNNVEILEDKICIQSLIKPYLVVEITNSEIAKNYRLHFNFLWDFCPKSD